jgi:hypothetical protein
MLGEATSGKGKLGAANARLNVHETDSPNICVT